MFIDYHDKPKNDKPKFELIPAATKLWATITLKPGYSEDGDYITVNPKTGNKYLALELTVKDQPYEGRKMFYCLGRYGDNKNEAGESFYKNRGDNDLVAILCTINKITKAKYDHCKEQDKQLGFMLESDYSNINQKDVYIEVDKEPETKENGVVKYPAKNTVAKFLIPTLEETFNTKDDIPF